MRKKWDRQVAVSRFSQSASAADFEKRRKAFTFLRTALRVLA
jgi:hypothetical protein